MIRRHIRRRGFTLVELLVVIAIITVLIAIGLPVMNRARETARRTQCIANLLHIAQALRLYRVDEGGYPGPYDPVTGWGGLNALYPTYLDNRSALICPDDLIEDGEDYRTQRAFQLPGYDTDNTATLLDRAGQMYDPWQDATGRIYYGCNWVPRPGGDDTYFAEHYSSYNMLYNWIGYVWWDMPAQDDYWSPIDLYPPVDGPAAPAQVVGWADNIAFWYAWFCWDPAQVLGVQRPYADSSGYVHYGNNMFYFVNEYLARYLAHQVYWSGYDGANPNSGNRIRPRRADDATYHPLKDTLQRPLWDWIPYNASDGSTWFGQPSAVFPGLINRNAPENTIITRCNWHRAHNNNADIALRLDGSTTMIPGPPQLEYDFAVQPRDTK